MYCINTIWSLLNLTYWQDLHANIRIHGIQILSLLIIWYKTTLESLANTSIMINKFNLQSWQLLWNTNSATPLLLTCSLSNKKFLKVFTLHDKERPQFSDFFLIKSLDRMGWALVLGLYIIDKSHATIKYG